VPRLIPVRNPEEAAAAARAIGFPVVVKPADSAGGNAVSVGLTTPDAVRAACASALRHSRRAVVESQLAGRDHRLLVVGGRLVAVTRRVAAHVTGDGSRTVAELIAAANARPERLPPAGLLEPLPLDEEARRLMAVDGWYPDSVPPAGRHIRLRTAANRSQGGSTEDVTAITHPDNAELACQAAALLGLDVAGIDLIAPDISRPVQGSGGGICEVNRSPSLLAHLSAPGAPDVAGAYLDHVLAGAGDLRIPVLAVVGEAAADTVAAAVADRLEAAGFATGLACGARTDAAGVPLAATRPGDPRRVMSLAADPGVAAVVVSVPAAALLAVGFGHGRCDGAVAVGPESPSNRGALDLLSRLGAETASFGPGDGAAATDRLVARSMRLLAGR
jgi:cyanophycin synthetase